MAAFGLDVVQEGADQRRIEIGDIVRQRDAFVTETLPAHDHLACVPFPSSHRQRHDLAWSQAQSLQDEQAGVVASSQWRMSIAVRGTWSTRSRCRTCGTNPGSSRACSTIAFGSRSTPSSSTAQ